MSQCGAEYYLDNDVPSFFTKGSRSSCKKGTRTLVRLIRSCLEAYSIMSAHSPLAISLRQTKPGSLPSDMSSSIPASTEYEIQDAISGLADDNRRRDSFSLSFARVLIGGTLIPRDGELPESLGIYFGRVSPMPPLRVGTFATGPRFDKFAARDRFLIHPKHQIQFNVDHYSIVSKQAKAIGLSINPFFLPCSHVTWCFRPPQKPPETTQPG